MNSVPITIDNENRKDNVDDNMETIQKVAQLEQECQSYKKQLNILLQNLQWASSLASMDSDTYRHSFDIHQRQDPKEHDNNDNNNDGDIIINNEQSTKLTLSSLVSNNDSNNLDNFQSSSMSLLLSSIHRLQSYIHHLSSETQYDLNQLSTMSTQVKEYKVKLKQQQKVTKKIYSQNKSLQNKLQTLKNDNKVLIKSYKMLHRQKREEDLVKEEQIVMAQSLMHENVMKLQQRRQQQQQQQQQIQDQGTQQQYQQDVNLGNRRRAFTHESTESDFEDLDQHCFDFGGSCSHDTTYDNISIQSMHSTKSSRSLVTDENLPTLRVDVNNTSLSLPSLDGDNKRSEGNISYDSIALALCSSIPSIESPFDNSSCLKTYTLSFPLGIDIGLQFKEITIPKKEEHPSILRTTEKQNKNEKGGGREAKNSFFNRSRSFSDNSARMKGFKSKKGTQSIISASLLTTDDLSNNNDTEKSLEDPVPTKPTTNIFENIFSHFDNSLTPQKQYVQTSVTEQPFENESKEDVLDQTTINAIILSDLQGCHSSLNGRPTLGSRLIAINDESLLSSTKMWTIDDVNKRIYNVVMNVKQDESDDQMTPTSLTLTFRNDPLPQDVKETLFQECTVRDGKLEVDCNDQMCQSKNEEVTSSNVVDLKSGTQKMEHITLENNVDDDMKVEANNIETNNIQDLAKKSMMDVKAKSATTSSLLSTTSDISNNNTNRSTTNDNNGIDKLFKMFGLNPMTNVTSSSSSSSSKNKAYPFYGSISGGLSEEEKQLKLENMRKRKETKTKT